MPRKKKTPANGKEPQPEKPPIWTEYRCYTCNRLLFEAILPEGAKVRTVCWHSSCRRMSLFVGGMHPRLQREQVIDVKST